METIYDIILLIFNILAYCICIFLILKRKSYTCLSIRSPFLLIINNFSGFVISVLIILYDLINKKNNSIENVFDFIYYIFQVNMIISFLMRSHRVFECCKIKSDERIDIQIFYNKRYIFQEKFYVKMCLFFIVVFFIIYTLLFAFVKDKDYVITNIFYDKDNKKITIVWNFLNFLEIFALITYSYLLTINKVKQKLLIEIYLMTIAWFLYYNVITFLEIKDKENENQKYHNSQIILTLIFLYICLILNGFFPIILSFCYYTAIPYHFNPKLMNNFYLFLSNEKCYKEFNDYLIEKKYKEEKLLKIYSYIMKFKLMFFSDENIEIIRNEATIIYSNFFENIINNINNNNIIKDENSNENLINTGNNLILNNNNEMFDMNVINSVKSKYNEEFGKNNIISNEENNNSLQDIFDDALKYCYEKLGEKFIEFRKTNQFQRLYEDLAYNSYIQCKMSNTGLINKF